MIPPRFSDAVLKEAIRRYQEAGHMVTLNILIDQAGKLNPEAVEQLKRIRRG